MFFRLQTLCFLILILIGFSSIGFSQEIPAEPENNDFTQDYANLIGTTDREKIGELQRQAFLLYDTPIIVVTIDQMSSYDRSPSSIEAFAEKWFDTWGIGTLGKESGGANKGILLLVSQGDRKARIELGADWGTAWDKRCKKIMDREIVPAFKKARYSKGVAAGVAELFEMAKNGPNAEAPGDSWGDQIKDLQEKEKITPASLVSGKIGLIGLAVGVGCLILAIFLPEYRGLLVKVGIFIIVGVLLTYLVLAIIGIMSKSRDGGGGGGGFSSGGGFSGGFSGGGGATGSW